MGWPVKIYVAVQNGKIKIEIPVFEVEGVSCYSAVMRPVAYDDEQIMSLFKEHYRHELGKTVELAVSACEKWIKEKLGQDVTVQSA